MVTCLIRHPRVCKFFASFGRCKFGDSCDYLHQINNHSHLKLRQDQAEKIENLKEEIVILKKQVDELRNVVNMKLKTQQGLSLPTRDGSNIPITLVESNTNTLLSPHEEPVEISTYKSENCGETFLSEQTLQKHSDQYEWGCEDCSLCLTSKYLADLHESIQTVQHISVTTYQSPPRDFSRLDTGRDSYLKNNV